MRELGRCHETEEVNVLGTEKVIKYYWQVEADS